MKTTRQSKNRSGDISSREKQLRTFVGKVIRRQVQLDGGDIRFVDYDGERLTVSMEAACSQCPAVGRIKAWLEKQIVSSLGFECTVVQKIKKPYYWA